MGQTLYLLEATARTDAVCQSCGTRLPRGTIHFRHDPFPAARIHRDERISRWCRACILASVVAIPDQVTKRIRIPVASVRTSTSNSDRPVAGLPLWQPLQGLLVGVTSNLLPQLIANPDLIHRLSPDQFEEFVCDRLYAMGLEPKRVGLVHSRDGGVDIVFWPRSPSAFPFLGAAQVKHHREPSQVEPVSTVRDFAGVLAGHPFNAGVVVTNTTFSPDAKWFATERAKLMRLREFADLRRWLLENFSADAEWREIPRLIELCPGVTIKVR